MPISRLDQQGDFDLLVKKVKQNKDGKPGQFTSKLENAQIGTKFEIRRGKGSWEYEGFGKFKVGQDDS